MIWWIMAKFHIDPHNDDMGLRVKRAMNYLAQIRRSGNALEPDHFPTGRKKT